MYCCFLCFSQSELVESSEFTSLQESHLSQSSIQIKQRLLLEVLMNRITGHKMLNRCFAFKNHLDLKSVNRWLGFMPFYVDTNYYFNCCIFRVIRGRIFCL